MDKEVVRLQKNVSVFEISQMHQQASNHRVADLDTSSPVWCGQLSIVVSKRLLCVVRLANENERLGKALIDKYPGNILQPAQDSSTHFILKIKERKKRRKKVGIAFSCEKDSSDFVNVLKGSDFSLPNNVKTAEVKKNSCNKSNKQKRSNQRLGGSIADAGSEPLSPDEFCPPNNLYSKTNDPVYRYISGDVFTCHLCPQTFDVSQGIIRHWNRTHQLNGARLCWCDLPFPNKGEAKAHFKKFRCTTFQCKICKQVFSLANKLQIHKEKVHGCRKPVTTEEARVKLSGNRDKTKFPIITIKTEATEFTFPESNDNTSETINIKNANTGFIIPARSYRADSALPGTSNQNGFKIPRRNDNAGISVSGRIEDVGLPIPVIINSSPFLLPGPGEDAMYPTLALNSNPQFPLPRPALLPTPVYNRNTRFLVPPPGYLPTLPSNNNPGFPSPGRIENVEFPIPVINNNRFQLPGANDSIGFPVPGRSADAGFAMPGINNDAGFKLPDINSYDGLTDGFSLIPDRSEDPGAINIPGYKYIQANFFWCYLCPKIFSDPRIMLIHWKMEHNIETATSCAVCNLPFPDASEMSMHKKNAHGFPCPDCDEVLTTEGGFKSHVRISHFKKVVFTCSNCGKAFDQKQQLVIHIVTMHEKYSSTRILHACRFCSEKFLSARELEAHLISNALSYFCDRCEAKCKTIVSLRRHYEQFHRRFSMCGIPKLSFSHPTD